MPWENWYPASDELDEIVLEILKNAFREIKWEIIAYSKEKRDINENGANEDC